MTSYAASLSASTPAAAQQGAATILDAGFDGIVLKSPVQHEAWNALREWLPKDSVKAIELFLPSPRSLRPGERAPFSAAAENKTERSENLAQARKTLEAVDQLGIPLVLIPMTSLNISGLGRNYLEPTASPEQEQLSFRAASVELRARMDSLLVLLSFLLEQAERYATTICLTPGNRPGELPMMSEALACLKEFDGAPMGLWLDTRRLPAELLAVPTIGGSATAAGSDLLNRLQGGSLADETTEGEACSPGRGIVPWDQVASSISKLPLLSLEGDLEEGRLFLTGLEEEEASPGGLLDA